MKTNATLERTTRTVGKVFFALLLLVAAVTIGFGGTALFVYHQFGDSCHPAAPARGAVADRRPPVQSAQGTDQNSSLRRVTNVPTEPSAYTFADNRGGQPTVPSGHVRPTDGVPAPLDPAASTTDYSGQLSDPESHYIVDARTGRVVGIDGSAGAQREAEQERPQESSVPPRAVAVQTPPPEVRAASPVLADGLPVYQGQAVAAANQAGSQNVPVRRALPVTPAEVPASAPAFNAGEHMTNDQDRPVLRAQAVVPASARGVKTTRVYRLPDGSQAVASE